MNIFTVNRSVLADYCDGAPRGNAAVVFASLYGGWDISFVKQSATDPRLTIIRELSGTTTLSGTGDAVAPS